MFVYKYYVYKKPMANVNNRMYHKNKIDWEKKLMMTSLLWFNTDATWKRMSITLFTKETFKEKEMTDQ